MRYEYLWRNKWLTSGAKTIEDMITCLQNAVSELQMMKADGLVLEDGGGTEDDYAHLVTDDPDIAKKHEMEDREEREEGADHPPTCECPICMLEMHMGGTLMRLDKIERALVNADLGFWCAGCDDFIPAGDECGDPESDLPGPTLVPVDKKNMN